MRDEQVREAELVLEVFEQVDDAGLDRHVERRDRLVEHEQRRARARARARCRCVGVARRRTRAGTGWRARGSARPSAISSLDPLGSPCRLAMPWMRIGSAMIDAAPSSAGSATRTDPGRRSASSPRSARHLPCFDVVEHRRRRKRTEPDVGSISCRTKRPVVDLPQPDSPTSPSVCPARSRTRRPTPPCTARRPLAEQAAAIGNSLTRSVTSSTSPSFAGVMTRFAEVRSSTSASRCGRVSSDSVSDTPRCDRSPTVCISGWLVTHTPERSVYRHRGWNADPDGNAI